MDRLGDLEHPVLGGCGRETQRLVSGTDAALVLGVEGLPLLIGLLSYGAVLAVPERHLVRGVGVVEAHVALLALVV